MFLYLRTKFQVSSLLLTSFRQRKEGGGGVILPLPHTSKRTPKKLTQIRVKSGNFLNNLTVFQNIHTFRV